MPDMMYRRLSSKPKSEVKVEKRREKPTEEELLAKAAAEAAALAKGISPQVTDAAHFVSFWPNQVLVSLVALAFLCALLLPQKLTDRSAFR